MSVRAPDRERDRLRQLLAVRAQGLRREPRLGRDLGEDVISDLDVAGVTIHRGDAVILSVNAANRDASVRTTLTGGVTELPVTW